MGSNVLAGTLNRSEFLEVESRTSSGFSTLVGEALLSSKVRLGETLLSSLVIFDERELSPCHLGKRSLLAV